MASSDLTPRPSVSDPTTTLLLVFVLVSFAANSLITRHVVATNLLDAGLVSAVRFVAGAITLGILYGSPTPETHFGTVVIK